MKAKYEIYVCINIKGYAVGQWLTMAFPYGFAWKYSFKFATIFGVVMFFGMLFLPETPRWLVSAGRPLYEALEAAQLINPDLTSADIVALKKEIERQVSVFSFFCVALFFLFSFLFFLL